MRIAFFSTKPYDRRFFDALNESHGHEIAYFEAHLAAETAPLAEGFPAVCPFVNDTVDAATIDLLAAGGTDLIALRSAGYNHVDLDAAARHGMTVARVPAYSPHAVAEHTVGLILALERKIHRAFNRVREGNFALEGLLGRDLNGKTVGVVGTGRIGAVVARIMAGFGCQVLANDRFTNADVVSLGARYVDLDTLFAESDIITLHCPLTPETHHLVDAESVARMRDGVMIINTSRGALVETQAVIDGMKSGKIGAVGLDVYEEEGDLFFEDLSNRVIVDDVFSRLLTFPTIIVTGHQAFFTTDALEAIARTTLENVTLFEQGQTSGNEVVGG
ncbi:MAG: 2-hydroxyacid dehydrogenase [Acidimicrobiia bacterium]|nr:2-hydroxyacid dehydrogenase [Acidimicrobiia bacterium]